MKLQDALELMRYADGQAGRGHGHYIRSAYVATVDGEDFFLAVVNDYGYDEMSIEEITSLDEWNMSTAEWRQDSFNPDGGWTKRLVIARDENGKTTLSCGHWSYGIRPGAEMVACTQCRKSGVGLDRPDYYRELEALVRTSTSEPALWYLTPNQFSLNSAPIELIREGNVAGLLFTMQEAQE